MTVLDVDQLWPIVEAEPTWGEIEEELRKLQNERRELSGQLGSTPTILLYPQKNELSELQKTLLKFHQDVGVQLAQAMGVAVSEPGTETKKLQDAYEPVTVERLNEIMQRLHEALSTKTLKEAVQGFMVPVSVEVSSSSLEAEQSRGRSSSR